MKFHREAHAVPEAPAGTAVTIGNFDGVHLGHQRVMKQLVDHARSRAIAPLVVVFEPHPREFFAPLQAPTRLTTLREKVEALRRCGVQEVTCLRFNRALAGVGAQDFVQRFMVQELGARLVIVGNDFRFGRGRAGDVALLRELGRTHGYDVLEAETFEIEGRRVSSSWVRELLAAGEVEAANRLLGRPFSLTGRVILGAQIGRTLGFPTANIDMENRAPPLRGVFAVQVDGLRPGLVNGVANLGTRPVFAGQRLLLEVFLFDWNEDIYGRRISVQFRRFLRPERNFDSVQALCVQMARDSDQARAILAAAQRGNS
ncbi:MAG: bifunctional riboflavin kinase/FAD synthetase [Gammaproteobacteria bacterium]|nr:bifunctional riboflavin kinase/FAD synthetase [Gammaproteobacteria bacterium]